MNRMYKYTSTVLHCVLKFSKIGHSVFERSDKSKTWFQACSRNTTSIKIVLLLICLTIAKIMVTYDSLTSDSNWLQKLMMTILIIVLQLIMSSGLLFIVSELLGSLIHHVACSKIFPFSSSYNSQCQNKKRVI